MREEMLRVGSAAEAGERGWWKVAAFEVLERVGTPVSDDEGRRRGLVWVMAMVKRCGLEEYSKQGGQATSVSQSERCLFAATTHETDSEWARAD